jgi:hypothetical protein
VSAAGERQPEPIGGLVGQLAVVDQLAERERGVFGRCAPVRADGMAGGGELAQQPARRWGERLRLVPQQRLEPQACAGAPVVERQTQTAFGRGAPRWGLARGGAAATGERQPPPVRQRFVLGAGPGWTGRTRRALVASSEIASPRRRLARPLGAAGVATVSRLPTGLAAESRRDESPLKTDARSALACCSLTLRSSN